MTPAAGKLAEHAVNLRDEAKARADAAAKRRFWERQDRIAKTGADDGLGDVFTMAEYEQAIQP